MEGQSRSVTIVATYLMQHWTMDRDRVLQYMRPRRPQLSPNRAFLSQLTLYEAGLMHDLCFEAAAWHRKTVVTRWYRNGTVEHCDSPPQQIIHYNWLYRARDEIHHRYLLWYNLFYSA